MTQKNVIKKALSVSGKLCFFLSTLGLSGGLSFAAVKLGEDMSNSENSVAFAAFEGVATFVFVFTAFCSFLSALLTAKSLLCSSSFWRHRAETVLTIATDYSSTEEGYISSDFKGDPIHSYSFLEADSVSLYDSETEIKESSKVLRSYN